MEYSRQKNGLLSQIISHSFELNPALLFDFGTIFAPPKLFLHNCFILNSIFFQPIQLSIFVTNLFVYPSQLILRIKRSIGLVINIRNLSIKIQATIIIKAKNNKFINNKKCNYAHVSNRLIKQTKPSSSHNSF